MDEKNITAGVIKELFSNPAITGFLGVVVGSAVSLLVAYLNHRNHAAQRKLERMRQVVDSALRDHHHRSNVAVEIWKSKKVPIELYPSVTTIFYYHRLFDILEETGNVNSAKTVEKIKEAKKEVEKIVECLKERVADSRS